MLFRRLAIAIATLGLIAAAFPASATDGPYCFCTYPAKPKYESCQGQKGNLGNHPDCVTSCNDAGLEGGKVYDNYNDAATPVDWQYQLQCLGPNAQQTTEAAKAARANWLKTGAVADEAARSIMKGSVVSLNLPLGGISPAKLIGNIIRSILGIVGSLAFLMFLYGGARWMLARGNGEQVTKAKQTIIWATLGLIAIFGAYAVVNTLFSIAK